MENYIDVLLPLPLADCFTYRVPMEWTEKIEVGKRALVPFGKSKIYAGIILRSHQQKPEKYTIKDIISVLDEFPIVHNTQLTFWKWIADYYLCTYGEVMAAALPSAFKLASETKISLHPDFSGEISSLSPKELCIVEELAQKTSLSIGQIEKMLNKNYAFSQIKNLIEKGVVFVCEEVEEKYTPRKEVFLSLNEP